MIAVLAGDRLGSTRFRQVIRLSSPNLERLNPEFGLTGKAEIDPPQSSRKIGFRTRPGEVTERPIVRHWKCRVPKGTEGSNPSLSVS
jgi:hypothetical protein